MFVDYYSVLEIEPTAAIEEIKSGFKREALKWHPDRNLGVDTTQKMQLINEAYLILKDTEARNKFDYQYQRFKQYQREKEQTNRQQHYQKHQENKEQQYKKERTEKTNTKTDFDIDDEVLKKWMSNARRQAEELSKQTIEGLKGMTKAGVHEGAKAMGSVFVYQIILSLIVPIFIILSKSCN
jgi:curved DNA-binding protein CbpA